jgi:hypothetical protein
MAASGRTMSDVLRQAIVESGTALIALERETGVQRMSITRFLRGEASLRLDKADAGIVPERVASHSVRT